MSDERENDMTAKGYSELSALALERIDKLEAELQEWRGWLEAHGMIEKQETGDE